MESTGDNTPLTIPPALLAEIRQEADREHRPAADVLRDVVEHGLEEVRWQRTLAYGRERATALGLTEADVPRLIAESRAEQRQKGP
jgi:hypothetical protein